MKTANSLRVKSGVVEVSESEQPKEPTNYCPSEPIKEDYFNGCEELPAAGSNCRCLRMKVNYNKLMKDFESSFVAVGNPDFIIERGFWRMFEEGIYVAPEGLQFKLQERPVEDSGTDELGRKVDFETVAICSFLPKEEKEGIWIAKASAIQNENNNWSQSDKEIIT